MTIRVALLCPGLGRTLRGYERFAVELFEAIANDVDVTLFRGEGSPEPRQVAIGGAARDSAAARALAAVSHDAYYWEAVTFAALAWRKLRRFDLLHYSEPPLNLAFTRFEGSRRAVRRRLFSHALNMDAVHTLRCHHIHQTSPDAIDDARKLGVPDDRMTLLPYGVFTERFRADRSHEARARTRAAFGIPQDRPVLLSVAALNRTHKRIDKLVAAIAGLEDRPHLFFCGSIEDATLLDEARRALGDANVTHAYVSNEAMVQVYAASDLFVMPSLVEGFGLAVVEAQLCGLPAIVHDSSHFRWLLDANGACFTDMRSTDGLARSIDDSLRSLESGFEQAHSARSDYVNRYDWKHLAPKYLEMYTRAAAQPPQLIESLVAH